MREVKSVPRSRETVYEDRVHRKLSSIDDHRNVEVDRVQMWPTTATAIAAHNDGEGCRKLHRNAWMWPSVGAMFGDFFHLLSPLSRSAQVNSWIKQPGKQDFYRIFRTSRSNRFLVLMQSSVFWSTFCKNFYWLSSFIYYILLQQFKTKRWFAMSPVSWCSTAYKLTLVHHVFQFSCVQDT